MRRTFVNGMKLVNAESVNVMKNGQTNDTERNPANEKNADLKNSKHDY